MNEKQVSMNFDEEKKFVKGKLIVMIFHNEDNLYSVARIRVKETNENYSDKEVVVTGYFPLIHEEEVYSFFGSFKTHPRFGMQYHVDHFQKELPETKEGVIQYLSSDLFKGIGKKTAEKIVETLGEKAISKILDNPDILQEVPHLRPEKIELIYQTLLEHQGLEQVMIRLSRFGFGPQLSMKIYQAYKELTLDVIENNPYQLIEDVEGIGFNRADELGYALGITGNHPDRIRAGCIFIVNQNSLQEGHVYLKKEPLLSAVRQLLEENKRDIIPIDDIDHVLTYLQEEGKLVIEDDHVYMPSLYFAEKGIVTNIKRILEQDEYKDQFPEAEFLKELGGLEEDIGVQYATSQREAIQRALTSPLLLLTGGPGTGKTTVIKGIVELYGRLHGCSLNPKDYNEDTPYPMLLVAPTGRAAKRMTEATGLPAVTIHRLLGWNGNEGFDHDEDHPVSGKLLIVDEVSMVDTWLMNQLLKSLPASIQVVLVGDEDQLPSVGPGQVLRDLLESNSIPTVKLTDIYRQASGSSIIELAHEMKRGLVPPDLSEAKDDRRFFACQASQILDVVSKVCGNALKKGYTARDIQVLAPMYRGPAGIEKMNVVLQELFNPKSEQRRELSYGDVVYRTGDKVLQLVNQPEDNVFNGDIGEIEGIIFAKENTDNIDQIIISFDGNEVIYSKKDLSQITHAYCCSIHKSQGSEFPIVVLPVVRNYYRMLRRNLLYTAITRSKEFLILCGSEGAFRDGTARTDDQKRQTTLRVRLSNEPHLLHDSNKQDESELEELSPYDFLD